MIEHVSRLDYIKKQLSYVAGFVFGLNLLSKYVDSQVLLTQSDGNEIDVDNVPDKTKSTDFYESRDVTISRTDGVISEVAVTGGRTLTPTRDAEGYIESVSDGVSTWTFTRRDGYITLVTVT